jgi:outer membrane protein OmpA-like peptidoglycan-associated protein
MKKIISIVFIGIATTMCAQDNIVPNHNFQEITSKVKDKGAIKSASPWTSPTLAQADLYIKKTKNFSIAVPANAHGEEKPMDGDNYAGILAYSYKGRVPRTYLQVKLSEKMVAGKEYCVTMYVSLSDLSKYACNHIGVAISDKELTANNSEVLQFDAQIVSRKLKIYEKQFYWTPICGVYTAKGGEEYITIGNFTPDEKVQFKKIKRPKGFTKPQTYDAYYYIDNISVVPAEKSKKCDCDITPGMENAEVVKRDFNSEGDPTVGGTVKIINTDGTSGEVKTTNSTSGNSSDGIDGMVIGFKPKTNEIIGDASAILDKIVAYLKENIDEKIIVTGYIDASESDVAKLEGKRVGTVYKYLVSKGISKERIVREMGGADLPIDEAKPAKNMRVEISIVVEE